MCVCIYILTNFTQILYSSQLTKSMTESLSAEMVEKFKKLARMIEIYHKEILCFFSTEFQCDLLVLSHPNNQRHEEHEKICQWVAFSACPIEYFPQLTIVHEVCTCRKHLHFLALRSIYAYRMGLLTIQNMIMTVVV